ncbi:hypothetical protein M768_13965 [Cellulosimicrobium cellulans F16]|uniref:DUF2793 domain-containing protein n=1 Tax=Cellulosimicrobium cellulans F16 TaxID=1350482 RepID=A0A0M0F4V1_CELCE|nr:hypothetical protein [Cellulosimicrobium cellulans]KON72609.1 hypothetical protein M768_13965 [Cellulosimicrobium cellulans F16]
MPTPDTVQGVSLPTFDDPPAVPNDLSLVWYAMIARGVPRFSGTAARDLAYPNPADGQMCVTGSAPNIRSWIGQAGQWTETFPLYGAWTTIPAANLWEPFDGNSWWARQEGEWGATNNILLRRSSGNNLAMVAGTPVTISGSPFPSGLLPAAGIYGSYIPVVIVASTTQVLGLLYWDASLGAFRVRPSAAVTLTGGSTAHYIAIPALRWLLKVPS